MTLGWVSPSTKGGAPATWGLALGVVSPCIGIYGAVEWDDNFEEGPLFGVEEELEPRTKTMNASLGQPLTLRLEEISLRVTPER